MKSIISVLLVVLLSISIMMGAENEIAPKSFTYILQPDQIASSREKAIKRFSNCGREWIITDLYFDPDSGPWQKEEIMKIRDAYPGRKILAYLSIGEAENYRPYWNESWDSNSDGIPDKSAPSWLCAENKDWEGNYKVKYWDPQWQNIILGVLNDVLAAGFDGVYLDIIDAFEFFEYDASIDDWVDNRENPETGNAYREDMIEWVSLIAAHARSVNPQFMVIPQNGPQLLEDESYCSLINGIGVEDLFTLDNKLQDPFYTSYVMGFLDIFQQYGKPVLLIEYGKKGKAARYSINGARAKNYVLLITDRELTTFGSCPLVSKNKKTK